MTGTARFVCSDPDVGDLEFTDVDAVLDALEAALVQPGTLLFDSARQSWQPAGLHPEVRAAWEARLRYRPAAGGLALPTLPSITALVRSLPEATAVAVPRRETPRRRVFARLRPADSTSHEAPRFATLGVVGALVLLAMGGWVVVVFAGRLVELAAGAVGITGRK